MLLKKPKRSSLLGKVFGGLFLAEAVACGFTYFVWNRLNHSRDFREKVKNKAPWALDMYYKMGEMIDSKNTVIRERDAEIWAEAKAFPISTNKSN